MEVLKSPKQCRIGSVADCVVGRELADGRRGADWFESHLLDYEPGQRQLLSEPLGFRFSV